MTRKPNRPGTKWTAQDRSANGDQLVQVRFSGRAKTGDDLSDATKLRAVQREGERPAATVRRLVREQYAQLVRRAAGL